MAKEYLQAIHKVEILNSLNSLRDYFDTDILKKSDAEIKINDYLNKYGMQSLFELCELFNECFIEMKTLNLQNYNVNIERLGIWERVNADEFKHYGLKYTDIDITYIIRNNQTFIEKAQDFTASDFYAGVKCNPEKITICITNNNNSLKIESFKNVIEIKEKIENNIYIKEYILESNVFNNTVKYSENNIQVRNNEVLNEL
ncbi:MAG: hypothetical protein WC942_06625 [Clostridia bacterium]|jgi:hypothetical protein|nr:hypothetical protein [Clostridia bacterium]